MEKKNFLTSISLIAVFLSACGAPPIVKGGAGDTNVTDVDGKPCLGLCPQGGGGQRVFGSISATLSLPEGFEYLNDIPLGIEIIQERWQDDGDGEDTFSEASDWEGYNRTSTIGTETLSAPLYNGACYHRMTLMAVYASDSSGGNEPFGSSNLLLPMEAISTIHLRLPAIEEVETVPGTDGNGEKAVFDCQKLYDRPCKQFQRDEDGNVLMETLAISTSDIETVGLEFKYGGDPVYWNLTPYLAESCPDPLCEPAYSRRKKQEEEYGTPR